ncbi:hypothetical protein JCM5353_008209, partial [Sporobolomyces roseus]
TDPDSDQERLPPRKKYTSPPPRSSLPPPTTYRPLRNDRPPYPPPLARAPQNPLPSRQPPMSSAAQEQANLDWMKAHPPGSQIRPVQERLRPSPLPPPSEFSRRADPPRNEPSQSFQNESRRYPSRENTVIDSPPPSTSAPSDLVNSEEPVRSQSRWSRPPRNQYEREEVDGGLSPLSRPRRQDFPSPPQQESNEINETSGSELDTDGSLPPINRSRRSPSARPRPSVPVSQRRDKTDLPTNHGEFSEDSDPIPASRTSYPRRTRVVESSSIPRDPPRSGSAVEESSPSEEEERPVRSPRQRPTIRGQLRNDRPLALSADRERETSTSEEESDQHFPAPTPRQRAQLLPSESASPRNDPLVSTRQNRPAEESQARPSPSFDPRLTRRAEPHPEVSEPETDSSIRSPPPEEPDSMRPPPAPFRRRQARTSRAVPSEPPYLEQSSTLPSPPPDTHTDSEQSDAQPKVIPEPMNRSARQPSPELSEDGSRRRRRALPQARSGEAEGEVRKVEGEGRDVEGRARDVEGREREEMRNGGYQTDSSRDNLQGESDHDDSDPIHQQPQKNLRRSPEPTDPIREEEEEDLQERRPIQSRRQQTFDETAQLPQTPSQSSLRTPTADSNYREDRENESNENPETAPRPLPSRPFVINQRSPLPASIPDSSPGPYEPTESYERAQRNSSATPFETTSFDHSTPPSPEPSLLPSQGRSTNESRDDQSDFNDSDSDSAAVEPQISPTRISRPEDRSFVQRERSEPVTPEVEEEPLPTERRREPDYEDRASESSRSYQDMDEARNGERSGQPMRDDFGDIYRDKEPTRPRHDQSNSQSISPSFSTTRDAPPVVDDSSQAGVQTDSEDENSARPPRNVESTSSYTSPPSESSNDHDEDEGYSPPSAGEDSDFAIPPPTAPSRTSTNLRDEETNTSLAPRSYDDNDRAAPTGNDESSRSKPTPPSDSSRQTSRFEEDTTSQEEGDSPSTRMRRSKSDVDLNSNSSSLQEEEEKEQPNQSSDEMQSQPQFQPQPQSGQAFAPSSRSSAPPTSSYDTADSDLDNKNAAPPLSSSASSYNVTPRSDYRDDEAPRELGKDTSFDEDPGQRQNGFEDISSEPSTFRRGGETSNRSVSRAVESDEEEPDIPRSTDEEFSTQPRSGRNGNEREFDGNREDERVGEEDERDVRGMGSGRNREVAFEPEGQDGEAMSSTNHANSRQTTPTQIDQSEEGVQPDSDDDRPSHTQIGDVISSTSEEPGRREDVDDPSNERNANFPDGFSNTSTSKENPDDYRSGEDEDRSGSFRDRSGSNEGEGPSSISEQDPKVNSSSLSDDEAEDQSSQPLKGSMNDQESSEGGSQNPQDARRSTSDEEESPSTQSQQQTMDQDNFDDRERGGAEDAEERQDPASLSDAEQDFKERDDRFNDSQQQSSMDPGRGGGRDMDNDDNFSPQSRNSGDDAGTSSRDDFDQQGDQQGNDFDSPTGQDSFGGNNDRYNNDFSDDDRVGNSREQDDFGGGGSVGGLGNSSRDTDEFGGGAGGGYNDQSDLGDRQNMGGTSWNDQSMGDGDMGNDSFGDRSMDGRERDGAGNDFGEGNDSYGREGVGREDSYGRDSYNDTGESYGQDPYRDGSGRDGGERWDENPDESWDRNKEDPYRRDFGGDEGYECRSEPSENEEYAALENITDIPHLQWLTLNMKRAHPPPKEQRLERAIHDVFESVYALRKIESKEQRRQTPIPTAAELNISLEDYHRHLTALQERTGSDVDEARERLRHEDTDENRIAFHEAEAKHKAAVEHGEDHHRSHTAAHHEALRADLEVERAEANLKRCKEEDDPIAIRQARQQLGAAHERQRLAHEDRKEAKKHVDTAAAALDSKTSSLESLHDPLLASHLSAIQARDAAESEVSDRKATLESAHKSGDRRRIEHAQSGLNEARLDLTKAKAEEKESKQGLSLHERTLVASQLHQDAAKDLEHHRRNAEAVDLNPNATPQEKAAARHAHATAIKRHAAIENRHQHLKDKLSLH